MNTIRTLNTIVFPSDVFNPAKVDPEFLDEANAVTSLGGKIVLVDHTGLESGEFSARNILTQSKASDYDNFIGTPEEYGILLDSIPERISYDTNAFYRGWMMSSETYQYMRWQLGIRLIEMHSDTSDYSSGYYFANWYNQFRNITPASTWFPESLDWATMRGFVESELGRKSYIIKDQVKSRKHEWDTACYAPDIDALESVINEFKRLQGDTLAGGIVVREYEEFDKTTGEVRVWWVGGQPVMVSPHPDTPDSLPEVDLSFVQSAVESLGRPFVTTDLARRKDGAWRVIEASDGQVSGIPKGFDSTPLFRALLDFKKG